MGKKSWITLFMVFLFVAGAACGFYISQNYFPANATAATPTNPTFNNCPYHFVNQLRCEPDTAPKKKEYTTLKNDLTEYINQQQQNGSLTTASVYFRDLQNGPIMTINGDEDFAPASLLKVPLLMTYLKKAEDNPTILKQEIPVAGDFSDLPKQNIKPQEKATIGKQYTRDELLTLLITQSDNNSWEALLTDLRKNYSENDFIMTLSDLGIIDPRKDADSQFVTVENYASIFRILFNSSYLNTAMSDKALELLTHADFPNGIIAGVPTGTKVAHKYGERIAGEDEQLHDCGIVYYTPDPYLICIMTRGHDIPILEGIIQKISQDVFTEVKSRGQ